MTIKLHKTTKEERAYQLEQWKLTQAGFHYRKKIVEEISGIDINLRQLQIDAAHAREAKLERAIKTIIYWYVSQLEQK